jgi:repressor of nif and glnA expression
MMSPSSASLEDQILEILCEVQEPIGIPEIEQKLRERGHTRLDTFKVREAVWRLISAERADFTPRRLVKVAS